MTSNAAKPSSTDVAREAEDVRAGLAQTLDQLRTNLQPENMVEEVVSNARIGANTLAESFFGLARENPIPALLVGAGCALAMGFGTRRALRSPPVLDHELGDAPRRRAMFDRVGGDRFDRVGIGQTGAKTRRDPPLRTDWSVDPSFSSTTPARDTMDSLGTFPKSGRQAASKLSGLLHEQPLILAAIGVAVGAAIGAALPITATEDEWMGSTSSSMRHAAEDAARSEIDELRTVASRTVEAFKESAGQHGLSKDNVEDLAHDVGERAKSALHEAGLHEAGLHEAGASDRPGNRA